jgi:hypothetical protein
MKFAAIFFVSLFGFALLAGTANAGECRANEASIKSALAAKHRIPTSSVVIVDITNTTPSKPGYVETTVGYETYDSMAYKTSRVTVKGSCK